MKILIDDTRKLLPDGSVPDLIIRSYDAAEVFIGGWSFNDTSDVLYVDHDLGSEDPAATGYGILCLMELLKEVKPGYQLPHEIHCVSDNGPGRLRINQVIDALYSNQPEEKPKKTWSHTDWSEEYAMEQTRTCPHCGREYTDNPLVMRNEEGCTQCCPS